MYMDRGKKVAGEITARRAYTHISRCILSSSQNNNMCDHRGDVSKNLSTWETSLREDRETLQYAQKNY